MGREEKAKRNGIVKKKMEWAGWEIRWDISPLLLRQSSCSILDCACVQISGTAGGPIAAQRGNFAQDGAHTCQQCSFAITQRPKHN